jgi:acetyl-CoA carboxylase carboxyl transferase subunit alpha
MLEFAWYSVIPPEACSAILFDSNKEAASMAENLKLTSRDLKQLGLIDVIIPEPLGGAHRDPHSAAFNLSQYISKTLAALKRGLKRSSMDDLIARRYEKFRSMGEYLEPSRVQSSAAAG